MRSTSLTAVKYIPMSIPTMPKISRLRPRFEPLRSFRHVYAPIIIAMGPNISGRKSMLTTALMYPKLAYLRVISLAGGYCGADGGNVDRDIGDVVGSCSPMGLPQLLQKAASLSIRAPHLGQ